jgi:hypothetical protein
MNRIFNGIVSLLYGVTLTPEETDDNTFVTFYKSKISL